MYSVPAGNYLFKVNRRNTRTWHEICSKLSIKTPEQCQLRRSGVFIVNFEHISRLVLEKDNSKYYLGWKKTISLVFRASPNPLVRNPSLFIEENPTLEEG